MEEYINILNRKKYAKNTIKMYISIVRGFIDYIEYNGIDINNITELEISSYIYSSDNYNTQRLRKSAIINYFRSNDISKIALFDNITLTKMASYKKRVIEQDVMSNIISCFEEKEEHIEMSIKTMLLYGLRISEVVNLSPSDVYSTHIKIRNSKRNKSRDIVHIDKEFGLILYEYAQSNYNRDEMFLVSVRALQFHIKSILDRFGLYGYSAHDFRRYYATMLSRNDVDIWKISKLLGHSSIETTNIYLDLGDDSIEINGKLY